MPMPLVSIVIPAYNHARYLKNAISSVLNQDYPNIELIVLNDGSTDNTMEVLRNYGDAFHWETQANMGQAKTLNKGWNMANGEILAYLSADDELSSTAVKTSVLALETNRGAVATYCDFNLIDPMSNVLKSVRQVECDCAHMLEKVSCPIGPGAFFMRTAYLDAGPWNPAYCQMPDYDFWLRLGACGRFVHVPQVLAGFRVHEGSQTYSLTTPERAEEPVRIIDEFLATEAGGRFCPELATNARASAQMVCAQLHLRSGRFTAALVRIRAAYRLSPKTVLSLRTLHLLTNSAVNRIGHRILRSILSLGARRPSKKH